jgi:anti-sigma factor RsiW
VTHRRAARLLTGLLDGGLSPATRRAVQAHARACPACRRRLREHEGIEALVRMLPLSLLPAEPDRQAQVRLWGLAHWFVDPMARARERYGISAVGVCAFALAAAITFGASTWSFGGGSVTLIVVAQLAPDVAHMLPLGWR